MRQLDVSKHQTAPFAQSAPRQLVLETMENKMMDPLASRRSIEDHVHKTIIGNKMFSYLKSSTELLNEDIDISIQNATDLVCSITGGFQFREGSIFTKTRRKQVRNLETRSAANGFSCLDYVAEEKLLLNPLPKDLSVSYLPISNVFKIIIGIMSLSVGAFSRNSIFFSSMLVSFIKKYMIFLQ